MRVSHVRQGVAVAIVASGLVGLALSGVGLAGCGSSKKIPKPKTTEDAPNTGCESSQGCKIWGWCTHENGECIAKSEQACKDSKACGLGGLCSLHYGRCVAKDGDCGGSQWCDKYGYCNAEDGVCKD